MQLSNLLNSARGRVLILSVVFWTTWFVDLADDLWGKKAGIIVMAVLMGVVAYSLIFGLYRFFDRRYFSTNVKENRELPFLL